VSLYVYVCKALLRLYRALLGSFAKRATLGEVGVGGRPPLSYTVCLYMSVYRALLRLYRALLCSFAKGATRCEVGFRGRAPSSYTVKLAVCMSARLFWGCTGLF